MDAKARTSARQAAEADVHVRVRGLRKAFGPKVVLDGVDIDFRRRKSTVIIGGSGTGKSVLIKCIIGILRADAGEIVIDGTDVLKLSRRERERMMGRFGMLFQGAALFDSLPVWENIAFGLIQGRGMSRRKAREVAMEKLAMVGMPEEVGDLYPAELSGGMQKRVGLARAIAAEPEIILFDEPTTGLDPIMAAVIDELIVSTVKKVGATAITITHDMQSVRRIADEVAMIHRGRIIWQGGVDELEHSGNPYVDQFIHGRAEGPISMDVKKP